MALLDVVQVWVEKTALGSEYFIHLNLGSSLVCPSHKKRFNRGSTHPSSTSNHKHLTKRTVRYWWYSRLTRQSASHTHFTMTDGGVLVAGSEPKPSMFARFKKQNKGKKEKKEKKPRKEKKAKKEKKKASQVADEDSLKESAAPPTLLSIFQTEKKKPRSEYQAEIDQLNEELKQTKEQLSQAQDRASAAQAKFDRLKRWATTPPV